MLEEESLDDLIAVPVSFLESAEMLRENLAYQFDLCVSNNRKAIKYLDSILHLIKVMKECAGICVTKAVLEQDGEEFPTIADLNPGRLYIIASMLFRKTHDAAKMHIRGETPYAQKALSAEIGLFNMLNRLKATEERIRVIHEKRIDSQKILAREKFIGIPAGFRPMIKKKNGQPRKAASYPVQKQFLKKKEDKIEPKITDSPRFASHPASTPMEKAVYEMKSEPELVKTDFAPGGIPKDSPWLKIFADKTKSESGADRNTSPDSNFSGQEQASKPVLKPEQKGDRKRKRKR